MKAGTQNHLKTKRLMLALGVPLYRAVGLLETLWLLCTDCCDEGNIGKYTDQEIADYLGWDGKQSPAELIEALAATGWLDRAEGPDRLLIHDWREHAPDFLKDRWQKREWRAKKRCKSTSYGEYEPDTTGQPPDMDRTVRSFPNQTQPNQTQPNPTKPVAADAADLPAPPANDSAAKGRRPPPAEQAVPLPPSLASEPFPAAWCDWLTYRRERRLTLRDRTMCAQLESLAPLGPVAAAECLRDSIRNGWQGVFPEKRNGKQPKRPGPGQTYDPAAPAESPF